MVNQTLKQEIMALEADFCAALSDPTRIFILYALSEKPLNVTELTNELSIPQPTTSRHLKVLRERDWSAGCTRPGEPPGQKGWPDNST